MLPTYWHTLRIFLTKKVVCKVWELPECKKNLHTSYVPPSHNFQFSGGKKNMLKFVNDYKVNSNVASDKLGKYTHLTFE